MALMRLQRGQRIGIFVGACFVILALLAHNPFNGYSTETPWTTPLTPECLNLSKGDLKTMTQTDVDRSFEQAKQCAREGSRDLPFSQWTSAEPLVGWLGNLMRLLLIECAIVVLTGLWVVLSGGSEAEQQ
ncbi:hypothetical protein [Burkholderia ubonensis]|uniref:hypothetical protein n=1 Tax=Burkholderia ubonensis TaxID=101571 RepID=UPI000AF03CF2|nr:hypothetical protein [Burkholderia ubonensis]